jgi:hypothetical protein
MNINKTAYLKLDVSKFPAQLNGFILNLVFIGRYSSKNI